MAKSRKHSSSSRSADRKSVIFPTTEEVDRYAEVAASFMLEVLELETGDYLITDESTLRDFTSFASSDTTPIWSKIEQLYGLGRLDVMSEHLIHIFAAIERGRVNN